MLDSLQGPFDAGTKFLLDKNSGKLAQFKIGREVIAAIPGRIYRFDRTQTLARASAPGWPHPS